MKFNSPLPKPLPKECQKAALILSSFVDRSNNGLDGVIPRQVLANARGFAIFTVVKAGFLFSARAGSGVVIAKLDNGSWSAPSAIGSAGLGVGGQIGAEVSDFLIVLNSRSAVRSFMSAGTLTLGGNMSIALGPLGRNGEAAGSLNSSGKMAAMYSYSKTRGLFGGLSLEGSVIVERQDANALSYHADVTAKQLLSGYVDPPDWAMPLIKALEACTGLPGGRQWIDDSPAANSKSSPGRSSQHDDYAFGPSHSVESPGASNGPSLLSKSRKKSMSFSKPHTWSGRSRSGSKAYTGDEDDYFNSEHHDFSDPETPPPPPPKPKFKSQAPLIAPDLLSDDDVTKNFETHFESDFKLVDTSEAARHPSHRLSYKPLEPSILPTSPFTSTPTAITNTSSFNSITSPSTGNKSVGIPSSFNRPNAVNQHRANRASSVSEYPGRFMPDANKRFSMVPSTSFNSAPKKDPFPALLEDFANTSIGSGNNNKSMGSMMAANNLNKGDSQLPYGSRSMSTPLTRPRLTPKPGLGGPLREGVGRAIALYEFAAVQPDDLSFQQGDVIIITKKSDKQDDWWTGKVFGQTKEGTFPANFVEIVPELRGTSGRGSVDVKTPSGRRTAGIVDDLQHEF